MARAQRKASLRDERFGRHQEGVRAGTEPPGFLDRLESSRVLDPANPRYFPCYVNADWPLDARPDEASLRLADAWLTWVGHGPVAGPDGVEVRIWIRSAGHDLPFRYTTGDQGSVRRRDVAASGNDYTVCIRRMPAGRTRAIRTFAFEMSARWYAVGLAQKVREVGITALRPADIPAGPRRPQAWTMSWPRGSTGRDAASAGCRGGYVRSGVGHERAGDKPARRRDEPKAAPRHHQMLAAATRTMTSSARVS
jgi:hypothetical protein